MNQDPPAKAGAPRRRLEFLILGLVVGVVLGFLAGKSLPPHSTKYDEEWGQLRNMAHDKLVNAPGYKDHASALESLLEKRHTEMRKAIHDRPVAKAYLPALFLFMREDAIAIPDAGAAEVLDKIVDDMFRKPPQ